MENQSFFAPTEAILEAVHKAEQSGKINRRQARRIRRQRWLRPRKWEEICDKVEEELSGAKLVSDEGLSVDWEGIIAFIERLMPLILQLIDLFS